MGAIPKHKISSHRKGRRRAGQRSNFPEFIRCPKCQNPALPHQTCTHCGFHHHAQSK